MYQLTKKFSFEAAHHLPFHEGLCHRAHGHSWKGAVVICGRFLASLGPQTGMLVDYAEIKKVITPIVEGYLDHCYLNKSLATIKQYAGVDVGGFAEIAAESPTSENIARLLWEAWKAPFADMGVTLVKVVIEETETSRCEYSE